MHENLQEMIKEVTKDPNPVNVEGMEPAEKKAKENGSKKKEEESKSKIGVLSLYDWFEKLCTT